MTATEPTATMLLLAAFETSAKAAQVAEAALRKDLAAQIARSERQRVHAFRRIRLIRTLADGAGAADADDETRWSAQKSALADDLGWSTLTASYSEILDALRPLAAQVRASLEPGHGPATAAVVAELERFEQWFEQKHGKAFYVLYDRYVPEVPVVDF